mmetsp:Transcript_32868/g.67131  ORF Transcript_32868/g.67131 Transcript_32868/m.67131 type:complete len:832 (-) Transcript_32868:939-3434(-)
MKFAKPVGATADLREMEYISALHQTGNEIRMDASIHAIDISKFLISRYGIKTTPEEIAETISKGFGGGGISEADGDIMDLTEVMAMLLIPNLIKAERKLYEDGGRVKLSREASAVSIARSVHGTVKGYCADDFIGEEKGEAKGPQDLSSRRSLGKNEEEETAKEPRSVVLDAKDGERLLKELQEDVSEKELIRFVLDMILKDVTGDSEPKPITVDLLRDIFLFYGEKDVAADDDLLQQMVRVASKGADIADDRDASEEGGILLDEHAFAYCLTSDVQLYDVESEEKPTTTYYDVFQTFRSTKEVEGGVMKKLSDATTRHIRMHDDEGDETESSGDLRLVEKRSTSPSIDYAVDSFRSKTYVILLWVTFVIYFMTFMFDNSNSELGNLHCEQYDITKLGFPCSIGQGVIGWLIVMAKLIIFGTLFIVGASIGHGADPTNPLYVLLSLGFIGLYTFFPLFYEYELIGEDGNSEFSSKTGGSLSEDDRFLRTGLFSCGVMLVALTLQNFVDRVTPARIKEKSEFLNRFLASGTARMERNMKQAANFKVSRMVKNACAIHRAAEQDTATLGSDSSYGRALLSYSKIADATEEVGGYLWTWEKMRSGDLFSEEGIWLNNRVLQGNLGQIFLCLFLFPLLFTLIDFVEGLVDSFGDEPLAQWRIMVPVALAFTLAELNALSLVLVYIPSTVRTVLKFRYGAIGSLHDRDFEKMRRQTDQVTFIFSSMFWGCLVSSGLVLIVSFIIFFILFLEPFYPTLLGIIASVIGLAVTITIKTIALMGVRKLYHGEAFYRSNPAVANLINVVLESWNLGISILFIAIRMVILVGVAFVYVARVG